MSRLEQVPREQQWVTQIRALLVLAATNYGKDIPPAALVEVWAEGLRGFGYERVKKAFAQWIATSRFMPQLAEIHDTAAAIPRSPEEEERGRLRLMAEIEASRKRLEAARANSEPRLLATYAGMSEGDVARIVKGSLDPAPTLLVGAGMTAADFGRTLHRMREEFLARNATTSGAPLPNAPSLETPSSSVNDLACTGGETEGIL